MKNLKHIVITLIIGISAFSCTDTFLEEDPPNILVADNLYVDLAGFEAGLNALYSNARLERSRLSTVVFPATYALGGTDIITGTYYFDDLNIFGDQITPEESTISATWVWLYSMINASNTIINRAEYPEVKLSVEDKNRIVAEARFFRAMAYRHLSYLFGPVPLNLEEASGNNIKTDWARNSVADVWAQIIEDLLFASENLSDEPNDVASNITSWVAKHYLAEMYLATNNNSMAEQIAQDVVDNSPFSLVVNRYGENSGLPGTPYTDMFVDGGRNRNEGNTEVMWSFQFEYEVIGGGATYNRRIFRMRYRNIGIGITKERGGRGQGYLGPTAYMISLYGQGDDRGSEFAWRKYFVLTEAFGDKLSKLPDGMTDLTYGDTLWLQTSEEDHAFKNVAWPSTRKFDDALDSDVATANGYNDYTKLRLASTYMLLAEAKFKNGNLDGAASDINVLRSRAHASSVDQSEIDLEFILEESARELFGEDLRKYTLIRNNVWLERTNQYNKLVEDRATSRDKLLPIPQAAIDANLDLEMEQNTGY